MAANPRVDDEEFLDMIASIQGSRMDDQRADAVALFPGLHNSPALIRQFAAGTHNERTILDDDQFFETLIRCQVFNLDVFLTTRLHLLIKYTAVTSHSWVTFFLCGLTLSTVVPAWRCCRHSFSVYDQARHFRACRLFSLSPCVSVRPSHS